VIREPRKSRDLKFENISNSGPNDCCTRIVRDDELDKIEMEFGGAVLRVIEIEKTVQVVEKAVSEHVCQFLNAYSHFDQKSVSRRLRNMTNA
jgi:hypothetical protein